MLIVRDLLGGKKYYDDFLRSPEGIATNILAARLRALQELGLIEKVPDPSDGRRAAYQFTESGHRLVELLGDIARWGLKNLPATKIMGGFKLSP
jgi:DNA-binding HxlR family transcriptional regulator